MQIRRERIAAGDPPAPQELQGVTKAKITRVLGQLDLAKQAIIESTFAFLDNEIPNQFARAPYGSTFADGARTSMLACHIGLLQRGEGELGKVDREGRDFWIKPLRDVGAVEAITLHEGKWVEGHIAAKNPNSAYRLNPAFVEILKAPDGKWEHLLEVWTEQNRTAARMHAQSEMAATTERIERVKSGHAALIEACIEVYAPRFLPGYRVIYKDDADGDRISEGERRAMAEAGVELTLADAMPDVFLWSEESDTLWVIEAVTSDGEVDPHKVRQLKALAERYGKAGVGFTTAYETWKAAAARQSAWKNIEIGTFIWILEDPTRQMLVESFDQRITDTASSIAS